MRRREFAGFVAPSVVFMAVLLVVPLALTLYLSTTAYTYGSAAPTFVGLGNYAEVLGDGVFWSSTGFTVFYTVVTTALKLVVGYALALLLAHAIRARSVFLGVLMVPMIVPPVVGALVFSWMFRDDLGLYDWLLGRVGLNVGWFSEPGPARLMLVLEDVWHQAVFAALVLLAGLQGLPKEPLEAAQLDGASWAQQQRYVVLPALRGLIVFVTIMSVMDGFRVFDAISVITKGGPGGATESLMIYTFDVAIGQQRLGLGSAVGVLTVLGILVMLFPFLRNTVREVRGR